MEHQSQLLPRETVIAVVAGLATGVAAGLVGVGGGEFRIPVLIRVLRLPLKLAAGVNLLIGLCTVFMSLVRRWGQLAWTRDEIVLVAIMGMLSLIGASCGCLLRGRLPLGPLKRIVSVYLVVIGLWMLYEATAQAEHVLLHPTGVSQWALAALIGFVVAFVSGVLGVAGGEMRIPAFLYLFAVPIKDAGTLSLAVSIPTVAAGALTDRRLGHMPNSAVRVGVVMGIASVGGALVGAAWVPYAHPDVIKGVLGVILLLATWRMTAAVDPPG